MSLGRSRVGRIASLPGPRCSGLHFQERIQEKNGRTIFITPACAREPSYAADLNAIDWGTLYEACDGYLLCKHITHQWREFIAPEYVLIDSRTGYTDVGAICTRQLPDAMVVFFITNRQNLIGLSKVVGDIRSEGVDDRRPEDASDGEGKIKLKCVMSNVSDLDDEKSILQGIMGDFQE